MSVNSSVEVMAFSRETRRRAGQSQRTGRGSTPPGPGGPRRPQNRGGCCLILIIAIIASIVYAFVQSYFFPKKSEPEAPKPQAAATMNIARLGAFLNTDEHRCARIYTDGVA